MKLLKSNRYRSIVIPTDEEKAEQRRYLKVLVPILDRSFSDFSYGFRRGLGPKKALESFVCNIEKGYQWVAYIDIVDCFPSIHPSDAAGIIDSRMEILDPSIYQELPQGHPISPFLCNLVLDIFDKNMEEAIHAWEKHGIYLRFLRYADDIWLMACDKWAIEQFVSRAIEVLEDLNFRTRVEIKHVNQGIDILGFTTTRWSIRPSTKSLNRLRQRLIRIICSALESDSNTANETQNTPEPSKPNQDHTQFLNLREGWSSYFGDKAWKDAMVQMPTITTWLAMTGFPELTNGVNNNSGAGEIPVYKVNLLRSKSNTILTVNPKGDSG